MRIIVIILILCLSAVGSSFAQNNLEAMRFLTVNTLVQYGQQLYDRGDFKEACAVFNHVLTYDSHQAQALQYLKNMGHLPALTPGPVSALLISNPIVPVPNKAVTTKSDEQIVNTVDVSKTESLKRAIEAQKRIVAELRAQIIQMRANL